MSLTRPFLFPVSSPAFSKTVNMLPPLESVDVAALNNAASTLIATSSDDFGGAFYPVAGITLLGALILYLSPPLADE